jgi:hypothetical protein
MPAKGRPVKVIRPNVRLGERGFVRGRLDRSQNRA